MSPHSNVWPLAYQTMASHQVFHVHQSPINGSTDGEHDVLTEQIRTTESLNAIMGLGSMTLVVSVRFFSEAGQS
jgi:hypothetical protein